MSYRQEGTKAKPSMRTRNVGKKLVASFQELEGDTQTDIDSKMIP
jgi:hypothetical protein